MTQQQDQDNVRQLRPLDGRVPPNDLDAEGVVLSALLIKEGEFDRIASIIKPEHFYSDANKFIFETITALEREGSTVDLVAVASILKDTNKLDRIGGTPYLQQLATSMPAAGHQLEQHARRVREMYRRRKVIAVSQVTAAEAYGDVGDGQHWIENVEAQIASLAHDYTERRARTVAEVGFAEVNKLYKASQETGGIQGAPTGYADLDSKLSGLHDGDLTIVAGRPGMGKTAFQTGLLLNIARPAEDPETKQLFMSDAVLLFSLEMPIEQLVLRILCGEARVGFSAVRKGVFMDGDYEKLLDAVSVFENIPFYIDDTPGLTVLEMMAEARKLQREIELGKAAIPATRLGAVGVDYIQLMRAELEITRRGNREQEVSSFSRGLKLMAKKLKLPVVASAQLNRAVEQRGKTDKRPALSDLRESGAIEQDADNILFLYRDAYYNKDSKDRTCEVIVAKQRNGPTGTIKLYFDDETTSFRDYSGDYDFNEFDNENPIA